MATHGSDINANELMASLVADADLEFPEINFNDAQFNIPSDADSDLYKSITRLQNTDLTTSVVDGPGTFDMIMSSYAAHLKKEFDENRISGAEYSKMYIAMSEQAMGGAVQFLLGRDAAFWQAANAQAQAIAARVQLATAKLQYSTVLLDAMTSRANYALTKLKLATEDAQFAVLNYQREHTLPQQKALLVEQTESARAQTLNTRTDGVTVVGVLGKQKDLYTQQITSFQRDAELKAARVFADAWTVQKTIDEGLLPPPAFNNANLDGIMTVIKINNGLTGTGTPPNPNPGGGGGGTDPGGGGSTPPGNGGTTPPVGGGSDSTVLLEAFNGNFENGLTGWAENPDPIITPVSSVWDLETDPTLVPEGGACLRWTGDSTDEYGSIAYLLLYKEQKIGIASGNSLNIRMKIRVIKEDGSPDGFSTAGVGVASYDANDVRTSESRDTTVVLVYGQNDSGWVDANVRFQRKAGAAYYKMFVHVQAAAGRKILFDQLEWDAVEP